MGAISHFCTPLQAPLGTLALCTYLSVIRVQVLIKRLPLTVRRQANSAEKQRQRITGLEQFINSYRIKKRAVYYKST